MIDGRYGQRLKALRESRGTSQEELKRVLGIRDRQTIGQIESGARKLTAKELVSALSFFEMPLEQFANPFLLSGGERFSWRQQGVSTTELKQFQARAGEWIGAFRELSREAGERLPALMFRLGLTHTSSFEEAEAAGEAVSAELGLGDVPSASLADVMESRLGILVLMVDTIPGVLGAACTLSQFGAVLINRNEPAQRRNFDLAHELFHLLTWDTMPPEWLDGEASGVSSQKRRRMERIEQLANSFGAGLLMPASALDRLGSPTGDLPAWINAAAGRLGVSSTALKWQLVNSGRGPEELAALPDEAFRDARARQPAAPPPPAFSRAFVDRLASSVALGHLSARRAASLVDLSLDELGRLCDIYGVERPSTLGDAELAGE